MSGSDEDVTVEARGVSVRKTLNDHQFETLAVVFDVRSGREEASTVTLIDDVPGDVPVDDIGFHPEYGGEHWHADGEQVVFSRTFEPGEQYTTVYGVRDFDGERAGLLAEPGVEVGAAEVGAEDGEEATGGPTRDVEGIDALVSEEDSEVVREVISGERDTLPGLEEEAGAGAASAGASAGEAAPDDGGAPADVEAAAGPADEEGGLEDVDLPEPGDVGDAGDHVTAADGIEADVDEGGDEAVDDEIASLGRDEEAAEDVGAAPGDDRPDEETPEVDEGTDEPAPVDEAEPVDDEEPGEAAAGSEAADEAETGVGAVVRDVGEGVAAPEDDEAAASGGGADEPAVDDDRPEDAADVAGDEITVPVTGGIARVLAKELRAGNVSYEDRRLLREELLPDDGSTDARIRHLQNQVADLEAYTDALEQFLDEEGGAQAALSRVEDRVDSIAGDVEAVEESIAGVDDAVASVREDVADVEDEVDDVADEVVEVEAEVSAVSGDVERVADDVDRVEGDLESVRDDVDRIDAVDRRLGSVEDDVSAIQEELEELATFRDRLSSVFGPGGMGGQGDDEE